MENMRTLKDVMEGVKRIKVKEIASETDEQTQILEREFITKHFSFHVELLCNFGRYGEDVEFEGVENVELKALNEEAGEVDWLSVEELGRIENAIKARINDMLCRTV